MKGADAEMEGGDHGDRALLRAWRDGELSDSDQRRLEEALRDPAMAREFLREVHLDQALRRTLRAQAERQNLAGAGRAPSGRLSRRRPSRWRMPAGRGPLGALTALAAALILGVLWWREATPPVAAQLIVNFGDARLDAVSVPAGEQRDVAVGAVLELPARGWASLRYQDGSVIEVLDGSRLMVDVAEGGKRLRLERGEVRAEVRKQPLGKPLVIATPRSETTVLGTRLIVEGGAHERVAVEEGRVRVTRRSDRLAVEVGAGETLEVPVTGLLAVARPVHPPVAPIADEAPPAAGLQLWLCADRGAQADDQGRVWQWRDRSPRAAVATQTQTDFQPHLLPDAVHGHAAVSFDDHDDVLLSSDPWPRFASFTMAVVLRPTGLGRWSQMFGCGWGMFTFHGEPQGGVFTGIGALGGGIRFTPEELPEGTLRVGAWQRLIFTFRAGAGVFYADGRLLARKPMPEPKPWHWFHLGRQRPPAEEPSGFAGDVQELLIYDRALTAAEIDALDRRFRERLGVER